MAERPILFNGAMVRAILAGRKTQARRVMKLPEGFDFVGGEGDDVDDPSNWGAEDENGMWWALADGDGVDRVLPCPFGQPGDRLWVRETFSGPWCMEAQEGNAAVPPSKWGDCSRIWYWADGNAGYGDWTRPRPSIHMPRWASRITLEITDVRVERLQAISEADALAEGIEQLNGRYTFNGGMHECRTAAGSFCALWESTGGDWDSNPWVWVIEFKRVDGTETRT